MSQFHVQDPGETVEYQINWENGVPEGATISTSTWVVAPMTASGPNIDGYFTVVKLTGGTSGSVHQIENTITLSDGETYKDSIFIYIEDK